MSQEPIINQTSETPSVINTVDSNVEMTHLEEPKLTKQQIERRNACIHFDDEEHATAVILHLGRQGENSWKSVQGKLTTLYSARGNQREYFDSLYDQFEVGKVYFLETIGEKIPGIRADVGFEAYNERIQYKCVQDFLTLFIVEQIYEHSENPNSRKVIGYRPTLRLKA